MPCPASVLSIMSPVKNNVGRGLNIALVNGEWRRLDLEKTLAFAPSIQQIRTAATEGQGAGVSCGLEGQAPAAIPPGGPSLEGAG